MASHNIVKLNEINIFIFRAWVMGSFFRGDAPGYHIMPFGAVWITNQIVIHLYFFEHFKYL